MAVHNLLLILLKSYYFLGGIFLTRYEKVRSILNKTAKSGKFETYITGYKSYISRLRREGLEAEEKETDRRSNRHSDDLIKIKVSWKNACKDINPKTLEIYINDDSLLMPNLAFKLHIIACRTSKYNL